MGATRSSFLIRFNSRKIMAGRSGGGGERGRLNHPLSRARGISYLVIESLARNERSFIACVLPSLIYDALERKRESTPFARTRRDKLLSRTPRCNVSSTALTGKRFFGRDAQRIPRSRDEAEDGVRRKGVNPRAKGKVG